MFTDRYVCVCVRERERERERQTDRQTDRQTETEKEGESESERETESERRSHVMGIYFLNLLLSRSSSGRFARNFYNNKKFNGTHVGSEQNVVLFGEMNCP